MVSDERMIPHFAVAHETDRHPMDSHLRMDRMPHIWCSGCGLGGMMAAFIQALQNTKRDLRYEVVVSGIGCSGRAAGYVGFDSFHTTHGRALPFATGIKLANPELNVTVISGDGDLFAIGGNHLIHAARRNMDLLVLCYNNYIYGMTGGQVAPTTPLKGISTTTPYGNIEHPFNLSALAAAAGATYVARWTSVDVRRLTQSVMEVLDRKGFRFIEIIGPCPISYGRMNKEGDGVRMAQAIQGRTKIAHGTHPSDTDITENSPIIVGKFVDVRKETFLEAYESMRGTVKR